MSRAQPEIQSKNKRPLTPERQAQVDAWRVAILTHGRQMLPRLRSMRPAELMSLMQSADTYLAQYPLHQTGSMTFKMPLWGVPMTGAEIVALTVFGLWVWVGEVERLAGGLVDDWGELIKAAL
jgi:hypothetical protein